MSYQSATPNYDLPQWQETDAFQMTDFNTAFSSIDSKTQPKITATGLLKGGGSGSVSAAISGTDYTPGTPTSTTITITFSNGESVNLKAYKLGRLIMYPGSVWVDKSNVTEGKVGTIPVGYRPVENFTLCPPSNLGYGGYIQFRTNGDIYIGQLMGGVRFAGFICNINYIVP